MSILKKVHLKFVGDEDDANPAIFLKKCVGGGWQENE